MRSATSQALAMLARRPYTAYEVERRLVAKGYPAPEVGEAMAALRRFGALDDLEAARATVRHRTRLPRGRRVVARELHLRGVADDIVEEALAGFDEEEIALTLARKEMGRGRTFAQTARALAARGFATSTVGRVLERVFDGHDGEPVFDDDGS